MESHGPASKPWQIFHGQPLRTTMRANKDVADCSASEQIDVYEHENRRRTPVTRNIFT